MPSKHKIVYCSWSEHKIQEWEVARHLKFDAKHTFDSIINFEFQKVETREPLLCDLRAVVRAKAISAYEAVRVPCIVEHAGLILTGYESASYPGGLTQPMWDALGDVKFVESCITLSDTAIAQAVVGYCDGARVRTYVGETKGKLKRHPAGRRDFYWDTVFCPEGAGGETYAEIADRGLREKVEISQSIKALRKFIEDSDVLDSTLFPGL